MIGYANNYGARRVECIYNIICPQQESTKATYQLGQRVNVISVGRQIPRKLVSQLILAVQLVEARLLLVGNGIAHEQLRSLVRIHGLESQVEFMQSMDNATLCERLPAFDLFAVHTEYPEFPKSILEALWVGLPVIVNENQSLVVPELQGDWVYRVEDTAAGYAGAIEHLMNSDIDREQLGRRGRDYAKRTFDPRVMEQRVTKLYAELIKAR